MNFEHTFTVPVTRDKLWDTLMDVNQVASCIDGIEELQIIDLDNFEGRLGVKMGPVRLSFSGTVQVILRDRQSWQAAFSARANDRKAGGGFNAELSMQLAELAPQSTELRLKLTTSLTGRIGQLGRPLIKKRVQTMLDDFASALVERGSKDVLS